MKTSINQSYIKLLIVLMLAMTSCDDFLETNPKSNIAPDNFYKNRTQALAGLVAVYDASANIYQGYHNYITMGDIAANGLTLGGETDFDQHTVGASNGILRGMWETSYTSINYANTVIDRVPTAEMDEVQKSIILGEARFLRALLYFNLVRWFGNIPLHISEVKSLVEIDFPASSSEDIYKIIVSDLEMAANALPVGPESVGRATKGTAKALLAKVHLTLGEFQKARNLAQEVIDLGIYSLWDNYGDVFLIANENKKESIFEFQFKSNSGGLGHSKYFVLPSAIGSYVLGGPTTRDYEVTSELISLYQSGDLRKNTNAVDSLIVKGKNISLGVTSNVKYLDGSYTTDIRDADNNFMLLRYADVLLMFAEAENEITGNSAEAYEAVNKVRRRAFGLNVNNPSPVDLAGLSQALLREKIWEERFKEFPLEGEQWFDLKRTGRLLSVENMEAFRLVYPIPQRELDVNKKLQQNPGY